MPSLTDYTSLYWANGWVTSPDTKPEPASPRVVCLHTGKFGLALDVEKGALLRFGSFPPEPVEAVFGDHTDAVLTLPEAKLDLEIMANGRSYRCEAGPVPVETPLLYPVRIVESGRFFQRFDLVGLVFRDESGRELDAVVRLEVAAWPDRLTLTLDAVPTSNLRDGGLSVTLRGEGGPYTAETHHEGGWMIGDKRAAVLHLWPGTTGDRPDATQGVRVSNLLANDAPVSVAFDEAYGWHRIEMPETAWRVEESPDHLDRLRVGIRNPFREERVFRLLFAMDRGFPGVTGMCPMLRDKEGHPTGLPVQISKNWHRDDRHRLQFEGPWFHGFTLLRLPPDAEIELEFTMAYARWGGVPSASHSQLCLIGWGHNQLWEEVAIGSWGESICYEPDAIQKSCRIDDVRPLMVWGMAEGRTSWTWTNNVGGGDFLIYCGADDARRPMKQVRAHHYAYGPCLTHAAYTGVSDDGAVAMRVDVRTPRSDDINRAFHHVRYEVLKPISFSRLAFYQLGADDYNWHINRSVARGNADGLKEEWTPEYGGRVYGRTGIALEGNQPWVSMHRAEPPANTKGAWANRGFVLRSWKAVLGGAEAGPHVSVYQTTSGRFDSAGFELAPPPGLNTLQPGDFVEADIELVIFPQCAEDYYGPNENLRAALQEHGDTWHMVQREARLNDLAVSASKGTILSRYPLAMVVGEDDDAAFEVTGGAGYVPMAFTGLTDWRGCTLIEETADGPKPLDQSVRGNDFWQADYAPATQHWTVTFNVSLDTPGDAPQTRRFALVRARP